MIKIAEFESHFVSEQDSDPKLTRKDRAPQAESSKTERGGEKAGSSMQADE